MKTIVALLQVVAFFPSGSVGVLLVFCWWLLVFWNKSINPILIRVYPCKQGWQDLAHSNSNLSNSHSPSCLIILRHPPSPNQHSCSPSPLASSTSSLVILASSCLSLQTLMLFSKHAHHPSLTHACTISLHSLCHLKHCFLQSQHFH